MVRGQPYLISRRVIPLLAVASLLTCVLAAYFHPGGAVAETSSPAPEVTALVISEVAAGNITATSAVITWTTNEPATSQVEYGVRRTYGSSTTPDMTLVTGHSVGLTGLIPRTTYYYRVKSTDASGNPARSERHTFRTLDAAALVIYGVKAIDLTLTTATIIWSTDKAATSQVEYGLTTGYGFTTPLDMAPVISHNVGLSGLSPRTTYHYRVKSTNALGTPAQSADYAFTTTDNDGPDNDAPVISNVTATNITAMGVTFTWTTNDPAESQVEYGTSVSYGLITTLESNLVTDHRVSLTGLSPQTTYHYKVKSRDASGLWAESGDYTFTTLDVAPPAISGVFSTDISATTATIIWTTSEAASSLVAYGTSASYGSTTSHDMILVTRHSVNLTGLSSQTTYRYKVKSRDASGLWAESGDFTFTTTDIDAPVISGVMAINITSTGAIITWTTDDPAESQVEYGTKATYGSTTTLDVNRVTGHSMNLTGLSPQTAYYYKVKSRDVSGLWAESAAYTLTTGTDAGGVPPATSRMTAADVTGSGAAITGEGPSFRMPTWAWTVIGVTVALVLGTMFLRNV